MYRPEDRQIRSDSEAVAVAPTPDAAPGTEGTFHKGVVYTTTGSIINIAALFGEAIIAARALSADNYGVFVIVIAVVNFLVVAIDFGCKTAVTKMIAGGEARNQVALAGNALVFRVACVIVFAAAIWLSKDLLLLIDPSVAVLQYAVFIPFMIATASFDELFYSILQGFRSYKHIAVSQVVRGVLRLVFTFTLLSVFHIGLVALIYSWIASFAVSALYQYAVLPIPRRLRVQFPLLLEMLRFGFPLQLTRFLWFAMRRADIIIVAALAGPASVAYYAVAARIPDALQRLSESYTVVYFPTMSVLMGRSKEAQATQVMNRSIRLLSMAGVVAALVAALFSNEIMTLLFSTKYAASAPVFALLMIAFHMGFLLSLLGFTLTAIGKPGKSLGANMVRVVFNIAGDLALVPVLGPLGAGCAALVSAYLANPVAVLLLRLGRTRLAVTVMSYGKQSALMLAAVGLYWWLQPSDLIVRVGLLAAVVAMCIALRTVSLDDLNLILPEGMTGRLSRLKLRQGREVMPRGNP